MAMNLNRKPPQMVPNLKLHTNVGNGHRLINPILRLRGVSSKSDEPPLRGDTALKICRGSHQVGLSGPLEV